MGAGGREVCILAGGKDGWVGDPGGRGSRNPGEECNAVKLHYHIVESCMAEVF